MEARFPVEFWQEALVFFSDAPVAPPPTLTLPEASTSATAVDPLFSAAAADAEATV